MTLLTTDDVVTTALASPADDGPAAEARPEEPSALEHLVRLLAVSYSNMPLIP